MNKKNIGICGVGNMGKKHLGVYDKVNGVNVTSLYDPLYIEKNGDYFNFLNSCEKLDGVSICTPSNTHAQIALDILKHNPKIKLLIEKPIDSSVDSAKKLIPYKKNIFTGHIERFNPVILKIKEIIKNEEILNFQINRLGLHEPTKENNNVVLDLMVHDIDIVQFIFGNPKTKQSINKIFKEKNNTTYALLSFIYDNIFFLLEASWIHSQKKRCIKILTPEFSYEADLISQTLARYSRFGMKEDIEIQKQEPLKIEIFNFLKFINSEKCEICTLEESLKNLEDINYIFHDK